MPKIALSYISFGQFKLVNLMQDIKEISIPKVLVFLQGHNFKPVRKHCVCFLLYGSKNMGLSPGHGRPQFPASECAVCILFAV